jgi:hypothetical protein
MASENTHAEGRGDPPTTMELAVVTAVSDDKHSVKLTFKVGEQIEWEAATDTTSVEALILALALSREKMLDEVSFEIEEGRLYPALFNPAWKIRPEDNNRFANLWIRNPGFGWYAYGIPRNEAANIVKWLRKIPTITTVDQKRASLPDHATSFGGDSLLITTTGLSFYYYGEGEKRIGPNPFEQVELDSDRAAGIVAGSIAERRLEQALRSLMRDDEPTISRQMFRPSGPLGPFSTKIDMAYLLGALSNDAYADLVNLKNIRNDLAHELEMDTFDVDSIRDRCKNFILVDRHVGPVPDRDAPPPVVPNPYSGLPDYIEKLADPRFRFVMTAQLLSYRLGFASDNKNHAPPWV